MIAIHTAKCDLYSRLWCAFEFVEAVETDVQIIFAGEEAVIRHQGRVDCRAATCGAPNPFMVEDTRKIRRIIETKWGTAGINSKGERQWPNGSPAYDALNDMIFQCRQQFTP
mmetsp:Transcript_60916/g.178072  ORF Transcript_60916/g.178072 Transcript_60916/m.178072 type:complete len:112 (+) Transcript_60916:1-336(+)